MKLKKVVTDNPKTAEDFRLNFAFEKDGILFIRTPNGIVDFDSFKGKARNARHCYSDSETECMMGGCDFRFGNKLCETHLLEQAVVQAANLRHQLKKYEDAEDERGWRDVKTCKPKDGQNVLIQCLGVEHEDRIVVGHYREKYNSWIDDHGFLMPTECVLFWMPSPEPMKEE